MTGCYPQRVGLPNVLGPNAKIGISDSEMTIAQVLKPRGYATACFGKWHLGHLPQFLPTRHGFDEYFGLPYSNDMWPKHPENPKAYPDLPLVEGERVVAYDPDQTQLTTWYTERAVRFIEKNKDRPFFLYVPHSMVHVPLHVSDKFKGKSQRGLFGDVIMEIDWSVGQILDDAHAPRPRQGHDGPVLLGQRPVAQLRRSRRLGPAAPRGQGHHLRRRPARADDLLVAGHDPRRQSLPRAGHRRWTCSRPSRVWPGRKLPDHKIDGKDIWPLISGQPGAKSPHEAFFYLSGLGPRSRPQRPVEAALPARLPHARPAVPAARAARPAKYEQAKTDLALYDLENDIGEQHNVADQHPDVVERLQQLADAMRQDLGDAAQKMEGTGRRPAGKV